MFKILDGVLNQFENPFDLGTVLESLINITTGKVATKEIENSLTQIPGKGIIILDDYLTERLVEGEKRLSFWDPQKKTAVLTFANMKRRYHLTNKRNFLLTQKCSFNDCLLFNNSMRSIYELLLNMNLQLYHQHSLMQMDLWEKLLNRI